MVDLFEVLVFWLSCLICILKDEPKWLLKASPVPFYFSCTVRVLELVMMYQIHFNRATANLKLSLNQSFEFQVAACLETLELIIATFTFRDTIKDQSQLWQCTRVFAIYQGIGTRFSWQEDLIGFKTQIGEVQEQNVLCVGPA